jgi:hypothetical protein
VTTVPGLQVGEIDIGVSASPTTDTNLAIAYDQVASWDKDHVTFASP